MPRWLCILLLVVVVTVAGQYTQWFGVTRPALNKVRAEANARSEATDANVAAISTTVGAVEQKQAAIEAAGRGQAQQIGALGERVTQTEQAVAEAKDVSQATSGDLARLKERVDANTQAIGEIRAHIPAATVTATTPSSEEQTLQRDLISAMSMTSPFKAAVAESIQTEGRAPATNAQAGLSPPERYADGALTRLAIEQGTIIAYFRHGSASATPRFRLLPDSPESAPVGVVRWKCDTNMPLAARLFSGCQLKPAP